MRFGLVGTGPWAARVHGPALAATPGIELAGVWGRSTQRSTALADRLRTTAYADLDALVADVEAVAFAVPPDAQAELAIGVAEAGRHLLLEKPVATAPAPARALRDTVAAAGVSTVVFFTDRFIEAQRAWFAEIQAAEGVRGGWLRWFSALRWDGTLREVSPWRHEQGALWDVGPHAISTLTAALGPIATVRAAGGADDLVVLTFTHASGATSTATLSSSVPPAASGFEAAVWGDRGVLAMPPRPEGMAVDAFRTAARELVAAVRSGRAHPLDIEFGVHVVELLAEAGAQITIGPGTRVGTTRAGIAPA